jgi:hypothetical protein
MSLSATTTFHEQLESHQFQGQYISTVTFMVLSTLRLSSLRWLILRLSNLWLLLRVLRRLSLCSLD